MSAIQRLLSRLTSHPKVEIITVSCPECQAKFDVTTNKSDDDKEDWKTSPETGSTTGDDQEDGTENDDDEDSEFEDNMTPKSKAEKQSAIAKSLLEVTKDRDSAGSLPHQFSGKQAEEAVQHYAKQAKKTASELLTEALNQAAKEASKSRNR